MYVENRRKKQFKQIIHFENIFLRFLFCLWTKVNKQFGKKGFVTNFQRGIGVLSRVFWGKFSYIMAALDIKFLYSQMKTNLNLRYLTKLQSLSVTSFPAD
jgi:hypothetical protein